MGELGLGVCVWLSLCSAVFVARFLLDSLSSLAKAHKGRVAIAVKHLNTGESYYSMRNEACQASLVKLPVMIEVYQQVAEGKSSHGS